MFCEKAAGNAIGSEGDERMKRSLHVRSVLWSGGLLLAGAGMALSAPMIELVSQGKNYQGLNIAHNDRECWIANRDGSYQRIDLAKVNGFRKTGTEFRSLTPTALGAEIKRTLGREYEVQTQGRFVVCAPRGTAAEYAQLAARVEKSFSGYFSRRGWNLKHADFPLVILVLATEEEFHRTCQSAGTPVGPYLRGTYHPMSNRVTLYDMKDSGSETESPPASRTQPGKPSSLNVSTRQVFVHETIHQLAFNAGLHDRLGDNPRWVVEGLATLLEAGALDSTNRSDTAGRVNVERLQQFQDYRANRRTGTISDFILQAESLYENASLDFYAEAWAFTFYLAENRRPDYVKLLKRIASRDSSSGPYTPEEQLKDLQQVFGKDLRWLETQYLRAIDKL